MITTPVAFLIFNRPNTTERVFAEIAKAKPSKLLVVADGPRPDKPGESEKCAAVRAIIERVDWDCEVLKNYSDVNLGCKKRVSSGLDWVFESVEEAVVLEDDCLPAKSFFRFCDELLERYRGDTRIMQICGANFLEDWRRNDNSYYFSKYGPIWGWASWRRAWKQYDVNMKVWPNVKEDKIYEDVSLMEEEALLRRDIYDRIFSGELDTWDYQWGFAKLISSGISIIPAINLISNIGFGKDATHTFDGGSNFFAEMDIHELSFPLKHPHLVYADKQADRRYLENFMLGSSKKTSLGKKLLYSILDKIGL